MSPPHSESTRFETVLPELREPSRARERFVGLTFGVVILGLLALVFGWGWGLQALRFEAEVPISGRVVGVDEDGALRLELRLDGRGDRREATPRPGDEIRIWTLDAPDSVLEGEVVRMEEDRIKATARFLDSTTDLPPVGTRVEGRWILGSTSGLDLLIRPSDP